PRGGHAARRGHGRNDCQTASALRGRRHGGAGLSSDRHPGSGQPRDRDLRPLRARSAGVEPMSQTSTAPEETPTGPRVDQRGLAEPDVTAPKTAVITGERAELDAAELKIGRAACREGVWTR